MTQQADFKAAWDCSQRLAAIREAAHAKLKAMGAGSGPMGLTPDSIKALPAYRAAYAELGRAVKMETEFNKRIGRLFRPCRQAWRDYQRQQFRNR